MATDLGPVRATRRKKKKSLVEGLFIVHYCHTKFAMTNSNGLWGCNVKACKPFFVKPPCSEKIVIDIIFAESQKCFENLLN